MEAVALKGLESIETMARDYKRLSREIELLEKQKKQLANFLLAQVKMQPEGELTVGNFRLKLVEVARENFDLKSARSHISAEVLSPFIKVSVFDYVRVS